MEAATLLVVFAACQPTVTTDTSVDFADVADGPSSRTVGVVIDVHDGDSLTIATPDDANFEVRLAGLNAPEEGECHHRESREFLIEALSSGEVEIEPIGSDQFGRTVAHVWSGDDHINRTLVSEGQAIATTPEEGESYGPVMLEAEKVAAAQRMGLWSDTACGTTGPLPRVRIEHIAADPEGRDEERLAHESVAIFNDSDSPVPLSGWVLRDESSRHRYRFPVGITLAPGETLTVTSADPEWVPGGGPVWNNDGDIAMLLDDRGRVVSAARY